MIHQRFFELEQPQINISFRVSHKTPDLESIRRRCAPKTAHSSD